MEHKLYKNRFTLIEMVIGIVILGILIAIVIPSIRDVQKEAVASSVHSNIRILQTAVDTYALNHDGSYPSAIQPSFEKPQLVDIEGLYPEYIKSKPDYDRVKNLKFWVDEEGKVWGSTASRPTNFFSSDQYLEWSAQEGVEGYNLYQVSGVGLKGAVKVEKVSLKQTIPVKGQIDKIRLEKPSYSFLISSVDRFGLETAPVGLGQPSMHEDFSPMFKKEGTYYFEVKSEELMYWTSFRTVEDKPPGTSITYEFSVKGENGEYGPYAADLMELDPSKGVKVKIVMKGANGVNPSLYNLQIFYYHASEEVVETFTTTRKNVSKEGDIIRRDLPVEFIDEFILPQGMKIKEIESSDSYFSYSTMPETLYEYRPKGTDDFIPVQSLIDIPEESTVRFTRVYAPGEEVTYSEPFISLKNDMKVTSVSQSGEVQTFNTKVPPAEWTTVDTMNFYAHSGTGLPVKWLKATVEDVTPENTRVVYTYATSNGSYWSNPAEDVLKLSNARSIRLTAQLQVKTSMIGEVEEPSVTSVSIESEKGVTNLSLVAPMVNIVAKKSNNLSTDTFSVDTEIEWLTETSDPRGKAIINTEWAGDKRVKYPVGTYEVRARVQNESGYWSSWTVFRFEVKPEKPIAVLDYSPSIIEVNKPVKWSYANSTDPDGDEIVRAEWSESKKESYSSAGAYTVSLRVQDADGNWSDWVEKSFVVYMPSVKLATIEAEDLREASLNYASVVSDPTASGGKAVNVTHWTNGYGGVTAGTYTYTVRGNGFDLNVLKAKGGSLTVNNVPYHSLNTDVPKTYSVRNLPTSTNTIVVRVPYAVDNHVTIDNMEVYGYSGSQDFYDLRTHQLDAKGVQSAALNNKVVGALEYSTKTSFSLRNHGKVTATVKNGSGTVVKTFFTEKPVSGGSEIAQVVWDGRGDDGKQVATGVYSLTLVADNAFGNVVTREVPIDVNNEMPVRRVEAEDSTQVKLASGREMGPKVEADASGGRVLHMKGWSNGYGGLGWGSGTLTFNGTGADIRVPSGTALNILVDNVLVANITTTTPIIYPIRGLSAGNHTLVMRVYGNNAATIDYIDIY